MILFAVHTCLQASQDISSCRNVLATVEPHAWLGVVRITAKLILQVLGYKSHMSFFPCSGKRDTPDAREHLI